MNSNLKNIGNFIFDMIVLNLLILSASIISLGILFLPLLSISSNELNEVYFLDTSSGAFASTFRKLKNNLVSILINSIAHVTIIGLLLLLTVILFSEFTIVKLIIISFIFSYEFSFWIIYLKERFTIRQVYKLSFVSMINHIIVGIIACVSSILLVLTFFSGHFYLILLLPLAFTLFFTIIFEKLINRMLRKFGDDNNEKV